LVKVLLASSFLFLDKKKRSKEKSSQQKTAPRMACRRLVLWQAPALLAIAML
jgi:hypothetical protein